MAEAERDLRVTAGHWWAEYVRDNDEMKDRRLGSKAKLPIRTVWAWDSYRGIKPLLQSTWPDLGQTAL